MNSTDFLTWWFEVHYVWSTFLTPFFTVLWLIFTDGNGWRIFGATLWMGILHGAISSGS